MPSRLIPSRLRRHCLGTGVLVCCLLGTQAVAAQTSVHAEAAAGQSTAGASGEAMPVGDLPGWRQVFTDDFTTDVPLGSFPAAVASKWGAYPSPWKDTSGLRHVQPVEGGHRSPTGLLNERHPHRGRGADGRRAAAARPGHQKYGQRYGRYAVRYRADSLAGLQDGVDAVAGQQQQQGRRRDRLPGDEPRSHNVWAFMHRTNCDRPRRPGLVQDPARHHGRGTPR